MGSPIAVFIFSTVFGIMAFFFIKSITNDTNSSSGCLLSLVTSLIIPSLCLSVASTVLCIRDYGFSAHPVIILYGILRSLGGVLGYLAICVFSFKDIFRKKTPREERDWDESPHNPQNFM